MLNASKWLRRTVCLVVSLLIVALIDHTLNESRHASALHESYDRTPSHCRTKGKIGSLDVEYVNVECDGIHRRYFDDH